MCLSQNVDYRERGLLRKLLRRNEWKLKSMLSTWADGWAVEGVTDIVLEDLSISGRDIVHQLASFLNVSSTD